ncbi:MAG: TylF/MycF/NovP-related O-methyltransferase [Pseudomonadota bacterium]
MNDKDYAKIETDIYKTIANGSVSFGILGYTELSIRILSLLKSISIPQIDCRIYDVNCDTEKVAQNPTVWGIKSLKRMNHDALVVASDEHKESILWKSKPYVTNTPKVILAGYKHFEFQNSSFSKILSDSLVPSYANGYPNTLIHLYQCLHNASRLSIEGVIAEFGMFKGGTTMFLHNVVQQLGQSWKIYGFDSFKGFPPKKNFLDMYDHPDCVWTGIGDVKKLFKDKNVEIVEGDISQTCDKLKDEKLVLTFVDTDNYSSAESVLDVVQANTVVRGAIVFDHFTGVDKFRYTIGERMAAKRLSDDKRYFNLHDTGVFIRQI